MYDTLLSPICDIDMYLDIGLKYKYDTINTPFNNKFKY